jgi:hypothetical protein
VGWLNGPWPEQAATTRLRRKPPFAGHEVTQTLDPMRAFGDAAARRHEGLFLFRPISHSLRFQTHGKRNRCLIRGQERSDNTE